MVPDSESPELRTEAAEQPDFDGEIPSLHPDLIDGYELTDRIAEGGMGAVFRAKQVSLDRTVAIKVLKPRFAKDRSFLKRFTREARAVARLNHKNVVAAIDVGESDGWHYLVMEYVDGPTLAELLDEKGMLSEREALRITWQVCSALRHAHQNGLVHRDVKPENVILASSGDAKLCDLGLAKKVDSESTVLTAMGAALGTPLYISPEQAQGQAEVDIRADIYSLGATFYHMVCGRVPFDGNSAAVVMAKHLSQEPTPVKMRNPEVSLGTAWVIEKMLAKKPKERYQTPEEVMRDLKLVASGQWQSPGPVVEPLEEDEAPVAPKINLRARRRRRSSRRRR
ncbi:MAG: serine/threonine protein kinase [Planctomycetota bacterium]